MSFLSSFTLPSLPSLNALSDVNIEQPIASPRPIASPQGTLQQGNINLGGIQGTVVGNVPSSSVQQPNSQTGEPSWNDIQNIFNNSPIVQSGSPAGSSSGLSGPTSWLLSNRVVSAIIGLIFIAGGLFMFKGTREYVVTGAKTAAKLAA